ncbi:hypothetical protein FZEAL_3114 [Fusarium zealandicum]|uniref:Uncharacterized protein n=1 Tax=Fusarium zealandicum TaxID=1053134 RepID=A0A8H4UPY6_9HYPO|nr:hypothetical protein FZEAL_3114 [Fusarium zealandicum]
MCRRVILYAVCPTCQREHDVENGPQTMCQEAVNADPPYFGACMTHTSFTYEKIAPLPMWPKKRYCPACRNASKNSADGGSGQAD